MSFLWYWNESQWYRNEPWWCGMNFSWYRNEFVNGTEISLCSHYLCDILQQSHSCNLLLHHTISLQLAAKLHSCRGMLHLNKATLHINIQLFSAHKEKTILPPTHSSLDNLFHGSSESCCHPKATIVQDVHGHLKPLSFLYRQTNTHVLVNLTQTQHLCQNLLARFHQHSIQPEPKGSSIGTKFFKTDHLLPSRFSTGIFTSSKYS